MGFAGRPIPRARAAVDLSAIAIQIRRNEFLFCSFFSFSFSLDLGGKLLGWTMFTGISAREKIKKGNVLCYELAFAI